MNFKIVTAFTGLTCLSLAGVWFIFPQWILTHWQVDYGYGAGFVSRRMACLFLVIGVMLIGLRNIQAREAQNAVSNGVVIGCAALIGLGAYELLRGHVNDGIFFAIGLESTICLAFLTFARAAGVTVNAPESEAQPVSVR